MSHLANKTDEGLIASAVAEKRPPTRANEAMHPKVMSKAAFTSEHLRKAAYYWDDATLVLHMDVREGLQLLGEAGVQVNCIVSSPPFYGQRDYEVDQQIGHRRAAK